MFTEAAYLMRTRTLIHQVPRIRTPIRTSSTRVGSAARLTPGRTQARDHMLVAHIRTHTLTAICTRLLQGRAQGWERGDITILRLHRSLNINPPRTVPRVPPQTGHFKALGTTHRTRFAHGGRTRSARSDNTRFKCRTVLPCDRDCAHRHLGGRIREDVRQLKPGLLWDSLLDSP